MAAEVERIELNGCVNLARLADRWPRKLRRLGLRGCGAVKAVPDFPETLDYADLAGTASLLHLPARRGKLRTLFLRGSGVLVPPASEHGQDAQENVAQRTAEYFADVELVGEGNVKRCKVLVLGNGGAGKTCLSLAVVPGQDPREAQRLGSTHGVQFWDWDVTTEVGDYQAPVHVHLWDFGGQEIYHNTHRLFMSVGAVFVVVWHPEQDGKPGPAVGAEGDYEDEWRPLRYWLDFIHHACPHQPRIAVVCSHQAARKPELEARWRAAAGEKHAAECQCYFVDSEARAGELGEFTDWLKREVGQVVATQGTAVPSYWELAQNLVSGWLPRRAAAGRGDGPGAGRGGGRGRAGETGGVGGGVHLVCVGSERGDSAGV